MLAQQSCSQGFCASFAVMAFGQVEERGSFCGMESSANAWMRGLVGHKEQHSIATRLFGRAASGGRRRARLARPCCGAWLFAQCQWRWKLKIWRLAAHLDGTSSDASTCTCKARRHAYASDLRHPVLCWCCRCDRVQRDLALRHLARPCRHLCIVVLLPAATHSTTFARRGAAWCAPAAALGAVFAQSPGDSSELECLGARRCLHSEPQQPKKLMRFEQSMRRRRRRMAVRSLLLLCLCLSCCMACMLGLCMLARVRARCVWPRSACFAQVLHKRQGGCTCSHAL